MEKEIKDILSEEVEFLKLLKKELNFEDFLSAKELVDDRIKEISDFFSKQELGLVKEEIDKVLEENRLVYSHNFPRRSGKTTALVQKALKEDAIVVCSSSTMASILRKDHPGLKTAYVKQMGEATSSTENCLVDEVTVDDCSTLIEKCYHIVAGFIK